MKMLKLLLAVVAASGLLLAFACAGEEWPQTMVCVYPDTITGCDICWSADYADADELAAGEDYCTTYDGEILVNLECPNNFSVDAGEGFWVESDECIPE